MAAGAMVNANSNGNGNKKTQSPKTRSELFSAKLTKSLSLSGHLNVTFVYLVSSHIVNVHIPFFGAERPYIHETVKPQDHDQEEARI